MDITTLRILTRKSRLGFGKHHDKTVGDVLICDPSYIAWAYYCVAAISFAEDILTCEEVDITKRIEKPGSNEDAYREYQRERTARYSKEERDHYFWRKSQRNKKIKKAKQVRVERATSFSKQELQAINHGKM